MYQENSGKGVFGTTIAEKRTLPVPDVNRSLAILPVVLRQGTRS